VVLPSFSFVSLSQEEILPLANHLGLYILLMDPSNIDVATIPTASWFTFLFWRTCLFSHRMINFVGGSFTFASARK
jgi:hypothetical protein